MKKFWDYIPPLVLMLIGLGFEMAGGRISASAIADIASLTAQVQGTVIGLVFSSYVLVHALDLEGYFKKLDRDGKITPAELAVFTNLSGQVHDAFVRVITVVARGLIFAGAVFFLASIAADLNPAPFDLPSGFRAVPVAMLFWLIVELCKGVSSLARALVTAKEFYRR